MLAKPPGVCWFESTSARNGCSAMALVKPDMCSAAEALSGTMMCLIPGHLHGNSPRNSSTKALLKPPPPGPFACWVIFSCNIALITAISDWHRLLVWAKAMDDSYAREFQHFWNLSCRTCRFGSWCIAINGTHDTCLSLARLTKKLRSFVYSHPCHATWQISTGRNNMCLCWNIDCNLYGDILNSSLHNIHTLLVEAANSRSVPESLSAASE